MGDLITVFGDGLTQIIGSVKEIIVVSLQYGLPVGGLLLALTIGIKFYKHISGVSEREELLEDKEELYDGFDSFIDDYEEWIDNHPTY